jgi:hypothetical protein
MKQGAVNILATSSFLALLAVVSAYAGSSTGVTAQIPFDFTVANKTLPAGSYTVTEERTGVLRLRSQDHRASAAVLTEVIRGRERSGGPVLVFNRYGDACFLTEAWLGLAGGFELAKSHKELELGRTARSRPRPDVILIGARRR